jgi:hypothetical protein
MVYLRNVESSAGTCLLGEFFENNYDDRLV